MSIGSRIKDARIRKNLTQRELAAMVGVTNGAIANYEAGTSSPKEPVLFRLLEVLEVDANYLFQDGYFNTAKRILLTPDEQDLITKYRSLDDSGKGFVEAVLQRECDRCSSAPAPALTLAAHPGTATPEEVRQTAEEAIAKLKTE